VYVASVIYMAMNIVVGALKEQVPKVQGDVSKGLLK
jgi:hypothetical protein